MEFLQAFDTEVWCPRTALCGELVVEDPVEEICLKPVSLVLLADCVSKTCGKSRTQDFEGGINVLAWQMVAVSDPLLMMPHTTRSDREVYARNTTVHPVSALKPYGISPVWNWAKLPLLGINFRAPAYEPGILYWNHSVSPRGHAGSLHPQQRLPLCGWCSQDCSLVSDRSSRPG